MKKYLLPIFLILSGFSLFGQNATFDGIHLFQTFLLDAPTARSPFGEAGLGISDFDGGSILDVGVRGGFPLAERFEIDGELDFRNVDPDGGDGSSGLTDLFVSGRYNFQRGPTPVSAGMYVTLPIGSDDIGQGDTDIGFFGALRHPISRSFVLTSTASLNFDDGGDTDLLLAGGGIIRASRALHIVTEFNLRTDGNYALLSGGFDYRSSSDTHLRGSLGLGVDDGAPDVAVLFSILKSFN